MARTTFREAALRILAEYEAKVREHRESGLCSMPDGCEGCDEQGYCKRLRPKLISEKGES